MNDIGRLRQELRDALNVRHFFELHFGMTFRINIPAYIIPQNDVTTKNDITTQNDITTTGKNFENPWKIIEWKLYGPLSEIEWILSYP